MQYNIIYLGSYKVTVFETDYPSSSLIMLAPAKGLLPEAAVALVSSIAGSLNVNFTSRPPSVTPEALISPVKVATPFGSVGSLTWAYNKTLAPATGAPVASTQRIEALHSVSFLHDGVVIRMPVNTSPE